MLLGHTSEKQVIAINDDVIPMGEAEKAYSTPLEGIFPSKTDEKDDKDIDMPLYKAELPLTAPVTIARPRVFIPVFPGINCEYDSARAFEDAGAVAETFIVRKESVAKMVEMIDNAQIVMLPGGFSAGDEPDGSGKFIATMLRNPRIKEAIERLLNDRDGLMLGICNGFQALVKLGLVPYGEIREMSAGSPTLTADC